MHVASTHTTVAPVVLAYPETQQNAVSARHVTKEFGTGDSRVSVLRGVDFDVQFGEMTMLVGPSVCGKTKLLAVSAGPLDPTSAKISVWGEDLQELSASEAIQFRRRNLGFVFQQYNLLPALTTAENAAVPLLAAGVPRKQA